MAIQNEPTRIQIPFADSGTKNVIPDTNSTPSASQAASWTDGFPAQCSLPLSAGGIPPARADFNGILNAMTQSLRFTQEGGVWAWDATVDYGTNRLVLGSDGLLYWSIAQSGPNVGGAQNPTADNGTYWSAFKTKTMPAGDSSNSLATTNWVNLWHASMVLPEDLYLDVTNGSDSNDGFSAATAKKTFASLKSLISNNLYTKPEEINIHIADGIYPDSFEGSPLTRVIFIGESASTIITSGFTSGPGQNISLSGEMTLQHEVLATGGGIVVLSDVVKLHFSDYSGYAAFRCYVDGLVTANTTSNIYIYFNNCDYSSGGTVYTVFNSTFFMGGTWTFSGTPTGQRYTNSGSSLICRTGSVTKIPGTSAGFTDSSSFYN